MAEEKSFKPSKKRLDKARKEGKTLKSQVFTQAVVFLVVAISCPIIVRFFWLRNQILLEYILLSGFTEPVFCLLSGLKIFVKVVLTCLVVGSVVGLLVEILQVGFKVEPTILAPKMQRLSFASGFKKIFSSLKHSWQSIVKLAVLSLFLFWFFSRVVEALPVLFFNHAAYIVSEIWRSLFLLFGTGAAILVGMGCFDYYFKRKEFYKELSMSQDELRREHKDDEGDPMFKSVRRSMHESIMQQDLVSRVRKAKVIIVDKA